MGVTLIQTGVVERDTAMNGRVQCQPAEAKAAMGQCSPKIGA